MHEAMVQHPRRRSFLLAGAAAAVASGQDREVRTGVIGVGNRGTSTLKQNLAQAGVKIAMICDTDPQARDRALSLASRDNPKSVTDWRAVVESPDVDAVWISTPCDLHAPMAAAALAAGKYVYCEKPVGITPEQVQTVLDAHRKAKGFLQIGQQLRYMPGLRDVIQQLHQDRIAGDLFVVKAQRHSSPVPDDSRRNRPAWYKDVKRSGDLIVENAIHNLDVCNWVANSRPVSAYGHGKRYFPTPIPAGTEMMDGFSVEYIYDNDMHLDYSQLYMHPKTLKELPNNQWYMVFGEKGTVDLQAGRFYDLKPGVEPRDLQSAEVRDGKENATAEFYRCIRAKEKPFADMQVAAVAALTAILGREAIYRRKSVDWKDLNVTL